MVAKYLLILKNHSEEFLGTTPFVLPHPNSNNSRYNRSLCDNSISLGKFSDLIFEDSNHETMPSGNVFPQVQRTL